MDRQTDYTPLPWITRMKSFNTAEGFNSYHIKWAVGKIPGTSSDGQIESDHFKTNVSRRWRNGEQEWQLRVCLIGNEHNTTSVNLYRNFNSGEHDNVPLIARVKLMNESKGGNIEFSSSAAFLLAGSHYWSHDWDIPVDDAKKLSKSDRYVVQCWMDIPKNYKGWQNGGYTPGPSSLSSSLARTFERVTIKNGNPTSDIELVIKHSSEDEPRFYCHRVILASRSPVFETMFTNDRFKESNERIVEIEDMDGKTLKLLLQYLYTGNIPNTFRYDTPKESIHLLLNAAEKYMLPELKDECVLTLIGSGNGDCDDGQWIEYLQLADTFNLNYLRELCIVALSMNMRSLRDQNIREKISPAVMTDLLDLATKRGEIIQTIEVKTP